MSSARLLILERPYLNGAQWPLSTRGGRQQLDQPVSEPDVLRLLDPLVAPAADTHELLIRRFHYRLHFGGQALLIAS